MNHRQCVERALNHEELDRCPFLVSFTPEFADRLRSDINIQGDHVHNAHGGGNTYELERALNEDMPLTSIGWANSYYMDDKPYVDEWGVGGSIQAYETPFGVGHYVSRITSLATSANVCFEFISANHANSISKAGASHFGKCNAPRQAVDNTHHRK